jgi:RNA binding exosome subunit
MFETDGLKGIPIDPIHNPDPISKYGVYAQYILEMADSERGQVELAEHADELPEDWRETMEIMASQGKYGKPVSQEKRDAFQEKMEAWKKIQETMKQIQEQMMNDLKGYYKTIHSKASGEHSVELPSLMDGFESIVNEALGESSNSNDFIQKIIDRMSDSEKKVIKDRIKSLAMKSDT